MLVPRVSLAAFAVSLLAAVSVLAQEAEVELVADLDAGEGSASPRDFILRADDVIFRADSGPAELELFRVDTHGTVEARYAGSAPFTSVLGRAGERIIFEQRDDPRFGATKVHGLDVDAGVAVELLRVPRTSEPTTLDDKLFFTSGTALGSAGPVTPEALWVTDGTPQGTSRLFSSGTELSRWPSDLLAFDGGLFFVAESSDAGVELWRSDGTPDENGERRTIHNFLGEAFRPIQDTAAFATCPDPAGSRRP